MSISSTTTPYDILLTLGAPVLTPDLYFKIYKSRTITYFEPGLRVTLYRKRQRWFDKRLGSTIVLYDNENVGWTPSLIARLCDTVHTSAFPPNFSAIKPFFGKHP